MLNLDEIRADLVDEHAALDRLVSEIDDAQWDVPTPAEGWTVRDQISHLAFFDEQAALAVSDPEAFAGTLEEIAADVGTYMDRSISKGRAMPAPKVLTWWRTARADMLSEFEGLDSDRRIAWYGPPMKPASFMSARIMETWAHGQDVADALDVTREATPNLKHVAHLGVLARKWSYAANNRPAPDGEVRVELSGPERASWTWGPEEAKDRVSGDAYDFCLVVTQRRHPDDTDLRIIGDLASDWLSIAQTYAGPPGAGRRAGQFPKRSSV
ncbi:MAG: TIGR03084 family metal-binding protein [Actinomycetota bacterium]|nr:TIGR03084 family metal-binding protein [Actinomycetota bacterium]